jgi:hypothetical protein
LLAKNIHNEKEESNSQFKSKEKHKEEGYKKAKVNKKPHYLK